jgi:hypothetical protein
VLPNCFTTHTLWNSAFELFRPIDFIWMHPALSQAFRDRKLRVLEHYCVSKGLIKAIVLSILLEQPLGTTRLYRQARSSGILRWGHLVPDRHCVNCGASACLLLVVELPARIFGNYDSLWFATDQAPAQSIRAMMGK